MPFQFCLIPNRALDLTVALFRGHATSLIQSLLIGCHTFFPMPQLGPCFFPLQCIFFFFVVIFSPYYFREEMTQIYMCFEQNYLSRAMSTFMGKNTCHLKDKVSA